MKFSSVTISRKVTCVSCSPSSLPGSHHPQPTETWLLSSLSGIISAGLIKFLAAKFKMLFWYLLWLFGGIVSDEKQFVEPNGLGPNLSSINFLALWLSKLLYSSVPQSAILCKASLPMKQSQQYLFQKVWSIRELSKLPKKKGVMLYATGIIWYLWSLLSQ